MRKWGAKKAGLAEGVILVNREWITDPEPVIRPKQDCGGDIDTFLNCVKDWTRGRLRSLLTLLQELRMPEPVAARLSEWKSRALTWPILTSLLDLVTPFSPQTSLGSSPSRHLPTSFPASVPHSSFFTFTAGMFAAQCRLVSSEVFSSCILGRLD